MIITGIKLLVETAWIGNQDLITGKKPRQQELDPVLMARIRQPK